MIKKIYKYNGIILPSIPKTIPIHDTHKIYVFIVKTYNPSSTLDEYIINYYKSIGFTY